MNKATKLPIRLRPRLVCVRDAQEQNPFLYELNVVLHAKKAARDSAAQVVTDVPALNNNNVPSGQRIIPLTEELLADMATYDGEPEAAGGSKAERSTDSVVETFRNVNYSQSDSNGMHELSDVGRLERLDSGCPKTDNGTESEVDCPMNWAQTLMDNYKVMSNQIEWLKTTVNRLHEKLRKDSRRKRPKTVAYEKSLPAQQRPADPQTTSTLEDAADTRPAESMYRQIREYKLNRFFYERSPETHAMNGWPMRQITVPRPPKRERAANLYHPRFVKQM